MSAPGHCDRCGKIPASRVLAYTRNGVFCEPCFDSPPADPLDAWRDTFEAIPETTGQTRLYLGPNELEQEATLELIEQQVTSAADKNERGK